MIDSRQIRVVWGVRIFCTLALIFFLSLVWDGAASADQSASSDARALLFQRLAKSSVVVLVGDNTTGSGTVIGPGHVLTCAHLLSNPAAKIRVSTESDNGRRTYDAIVLAVDRVRDLMLISAPTLYAPALPLAQERPRLFERVFVIGSPLAIPNTASEAILTSVRRGRPADMGAGAKGIVWQITGGFLYYGVSGGTAANDKGELVCVPQAVFGANGRLIPQIGYCISLDDIRTFLVNNLPEPTPQ